MPWTHDAVLRINIIRDGNARASLRLAGDLDFSSAQAAHGAVAELAAESRQIVLDLSRVTFCDAAGIRFLIAARRQARDAGTRLVVRYPRRSISRLLDLTGALPLVFPDAASARVPVPDADAVSACEAALAEAIRAGGADIGNVQLVDPDARALRIVAQQGFGRDFLNFFEIVHDEESACGTALMAGRPVWVPEVASSPIFVGSPSLEVVLDAGVRAVASVPVRAQDGPVMGMISVHYRQPTIWTEQQRRQLVAVAAMAGRWLKPVPAPDAAIAEFANI